MTMPRTVNPLLQLVSDYLGADTGEDGGYDDSMRVVLPDLDFGEPDRIKSLESVEIVYESLHPVSITLKVWRQARIEDAGTTSEEVTATGYTAATSQPGVYWGTNVPVWDTAGYAPITRWNAVASFTMMQGKSFRVGLRVDADLTPVRIVKLSFRYHTEGMGKGSGVLD